MAEVEYADSKCLVEVIRLYENNGYKGGVSDGDVVIVAKQENEMVGAVRLCTEFGVTVLRGMQIAQNFQRRSIGSRILEFSVPALNQRKAYCLPYEHLMTFYGQVGFVLAKDEMAPQFLYERMSIYQGNGQNVVLMVRSPAL